MSGYYAKNPHYAPDSYEDEELDERRREEAHTWFKPLVKRQQERFNESIRAIYYLWDTPQWSRRMDAINKEWQLSTAAARIVYELALRDLRATGEISEATIFAFERVQAHDAERVAAA